MIEAGGLVSEEMYDAHIQKCMGGLGGCKKLKMSKFKYKKIVKAYLNEEIDSVTGIWLTMNEVAKGE